jgi:hypothetical protein
MNANQFETLRRTAERRERRDDHLNQEERAELVAAFRELNPSAELPLDADDAFVAVVF